MITMKVAIRLSSQATDKDMTKVVLDSDLRKKLNGLREQVEICDEAGETVGHFLPAAAYRDLLKGLAESVFDPQDVALARKQTGGKTLPEIWDRLNHQ